MGWTSKTYRQATHGTITKPQLREFIFDEFVGYGYAIFAASFYKDANQHELYLILTNPAGKLFICLVLIKIEGGEIYWKNITESEHPYYFNCPVSFFSKVPVAETEWREECKKVNAQPNLIDL